MSASRLLAALAQRRTLATAAQAHEMAPPGAGPRSLAETNLAVGQVPLPPLDTLKPKTAIPGPPGLPLLGPILEFLPRASNDYKGHQRLFKMFDSWRQRYGDIVRVNMLNLERIFIFQPTDWEKVMRATARNPLREGIDPWRIYRAQRKLPPGLFNVGGDEWRHVRRVLDKRLMNIPTVDTYLPRLDPIARDLAQLLDEKVTQQRVPSAPPAGVSSEAWQRTVHGVGVQPLVFSWALESISAIVLGQRVNVLAQQPPAEAQELFDCMDRLFKLTNHMVFSPMWRYLPSPTWNKMYRTWDRIHELINAQLDKHLKLLTDGKIEPGTSLLEYTITHRELTRPEALLNSGDVIAGGIDTTSNLIMWTMYALGTNPAAQERVYDEVRRLDAANRPLTVDDLKRTPLIKAALRETFRLFPITWVTDRVLDTDVELQGYHITPGTLISYSWWSQTRSPTNFPNPELWIPERWDKDRATPDIVAADMHPFSVLPFGFGPRSCIGQRVAMLEAQVALVRLLERFRFTYDHPDKPEMIMRMLVAPDRAVRPTLWRR